MLTRALRSIFTLKPSLLTVERDLAPLFCLLAALILLQNFYLTIPYLLYRIFTKTPGITGALAYNLAIFSWWVSILSQPFETLYLVSLEALKWPLDCLVS